MTDKNHCSQCGATLNEFEKTTSSLYKGHSLVGTCTNCKVEWVKENHGDADSELFKLRDKARHRNFKFMQKKRAAGSRQCSAILSQDAYNTLTRLRDAAAQIGKPQSFGDIIEAALNVYVSLGQSKQNDTTSEHKDDDTGDSKDNATYVCSDDNINTEQESKQNYICVKEIEDPTPESKTIESVALPEPQEPAPSNSKPRVTVELHATSKLEPTEKKVSETQTEIPPPMPDRSDREAYGKWLVNEIDRLKDSGMGWVKITDKFNTEGIAGVSGKTFGRGAVQRFHKLEIERQNRKS